MRPHSALRSRGAGDSERGQPRRRLGGTSERIDDEVRRDVLTSTYARPSDPNLVSRRGCGHKFDHSRVGQHFDVCLSVHRRLKSDFEERPPSPDRDERLILRLRIARQELVLTILHRPETEDCVEDIACFLQEHTPGEAKEVVRLAEVSNAGALPVVKKLLRAAPISDRSVALEQCYAPSASPESEGCRQAGQSTAQHCDVRSKL